MTGGIYLHYPFCIKRCHYCDFTSYTDLREAKNLVISYQQEITQRSKQKFSTQTFDTIYFGGGTPSLMDIADLKLLLRTIQDHLELSPQAVREVTLEANPETVTEEKAEQWKRLGFNRISMGAQSGDDRVLCFSGRIHQAERIETAYHQLKKAGFENINLDFIVGLPGETGRTVEKNYDLISRLKPNHLSVYFLTLNENSPLFLELSSGCLQLPSEKSVVSRWNNYLSFLKKEGYDHYEISNFCLPGKESMHNLHYWHLDPSLGIGVSAVGFDGEVRYSNPKNIKDYQQVDFSTLPTNFSEKITPTKLKREKIMLGLRLLQQGIDVSLFRQTKRGILDRWIIDGCLMKQENRILLTEKGVLFSNQVISSLF